MGRKADRLRALEQRASADRKAMEAACDEMDASDVDDPHAVAAYDLLADRLQDDPRPASDEGSLHWLHVQDGDRLVWRIVAELIELHDAEAERLGRPTWKHHPQQPVAWMEAEEPEDSGLVIDVETPPLVRLDAQLILDLGPDAYSLLVSVRDVTFDQATGWVIHVDEVPSDVPDEPERTIEGCEDSP